MMAAAKKRSVQTDSGINALRKEWDEALCPICMEYPHNAVLLVCSSHGKGCRPYVCDTSYRHSNCLDRYRKVKADCEASLPLNQQDPNNTPERSGGLSEDEVEEVLQSHYPRGGSLIEDLGVADLEASMAGTEKMDLKCPLCRGDVQGWKIAVEARKFLNVRSRSCSSDSCQFVGDYQELRRHARSAHPSARPAEIDPSREQAWRSLENQRQNDDVVSAIRSAVPGAIVFGDYVLEIDDSDRSATQSGSSPVWTSYFLSQMLSETRAARSRHRRVSAATSYRERYLALLGLGLPDESDDDSHSEVNASNANNAEPFLRSRRRDEAADVINGGSTEPAYRRLYLSMLGLEEETADPSVNSNEPSLRRRRDEVDVINIDDDDDDTVAVAVEELPVPRRRRLTQVEPNRNEP